MSVSPLHVSAVPSADAHPFGRRKQAPAFAGVAVDIRKKFFRMRVVRHRDRLPRGVVDALGLDRALRYLT